jgi:hypothetical protein
MGQGTDHRSQVRELKEEGNQDFADELVAAPGTKKI